APAVRQVGRRQCSAHPRDVLGAHELQQLHVRRLHHFADGPEGIRAQTRLLRGRYARHVPEGGVEETGLRGCVRDRGDGGVASRHGDARRSEAAPHAGTHVLPVLAAHVLRRRVHLRQMIGDRASAVLVVGQLVGAPLPLAAVDGGQALVGGVLPGLLRAAAQRRGERCGHRGDQQAAHEVLSTPATGALTRGVSILEPLRAAQAIRYKQRPMWKLIAAISLGASLGALLRWWLGLTLNAHFPAIPPGTLAANLIGGYVVGVAVAFFATYSAVAPEWRLLVITGFCGGLTTFSTFSAEVVTLMQQGRALWALGAVAAHLAGSFLMTFAGIGTVVL